MPKTLQSRLFFALAVVVLLSITARNLYRRYLSRALIHAVETQNVSAVRSLLDRGVNANTTRPLENSRYPGEPALSLAIESSGAVTDPKKRDEIACLLIEHGADVRNNARGNSVYLQIACSSGDPTILRCLLEHGANARFVDVGHNTLLDSAIAYGKYNSSYGTYAAPATQSINVQAQAAYAAPAARRANGQAQAALEKTRRLAVSREMVGLLRQHGARLTVLEAVQMEDAALLRETLDAGANVNEQDTNGASALGVAAVNGDLAAMQMLLAHGADANLIQKYAGTVLNQTITSRGSLEAVKLLLAHGAKINVVGKDFDPPLVAAIAGTRADIARLLLARGADPNLERAEGSYMGGPLSAAARDLPEFVPELLARHADINGDDGKPLRAALSAHRPDLVRYLLGRGAKIYPALSRLAFQPPALNPDARPQPTIVTTPSTLQTAVMYCPECFELLLRNGADFSPEKADILLTAARAGRADLFDRLIALGANVNAADRSGDTPLTEALFHAPQGVATLLTHGIATLLAHGANPNVSVLGQTPLLGAIQTRNMELARLLLAHGADANLKPPRGHTPLYFARRHNNAEMVKMLEQAGARAE